MERLHIRIFAQAADPKTHPLLPILPDAHIARLWGDGNSLDKREGEAK
jgi:hypothetical protein